jgi:ATP synthase F1 gamma subunit
MITQKQIASELTTLVDLQQIIGAFEEIAASRMQRIRKKVLSNREFLEGLNKIYHQVRASYKEALERRKLKSVRETNGKTVRVLLSANTGLYGPIVRKTFNMYIKDLKKGEADSVVVGRLGRILLEAEHLGRKAKYYSVPDQVVGFDQLKEIAEYLSSYSTVVVYHGLFKNILSQQESATDITGGGKLSEIEEAEFEKWIFEPDLREVMKYFETEIFTSLLMHTIHEAQLAKFASRMVTLDAAGERIKEARMKAFLEKQRLRHMMANYKMISGLSGMSLWGVR